MILQFSLADNDKARIRKLYIVNFNIWFIYVIYKKINLILQKSFVI